MHARPELDRRVLRVTHVYEEGMRFLNAGDQVPQARRLLDGRAIQVTPEAAKTIREQAE